jgi:phospho-N-acetylmuramoyl-pentapeptide-transferase
MLKTSIFFIISIVIYIVLIVVLRKLKGFQRIYKLSPKTHMAKKNIPSFGGVGILLSVLIGLWLFKVFSPSVLWCISLFSAFAAIGFVDDLLAIAKKDNEGLTPLGKFIIQVLTSCIFLLLFTFTIRSISLLDFFIYWFAIVGASNATNVSDGLDGLLAGLSIISLIGFFLYFNSLGIKTMESLSGIVIISLLAFIVFNFKPAKIFMGDTGALSIGALFAALAVIANSPWILIPLGGVYILETLCVIIQVVFFRLKEKRIFLMAPLHHHFELLGFSEIKIVLMFWVIGIIFLISMLLDKNLIF